MITEQNKNRVEPLFLLCENDLGPVNDFDLAQLITLKPPKIGPVNNSTACIYIYIYVCIYTQSVALKIDPLEFYKDSDVALNFRN